MRKTFWIYKITNNITGKFYIGQTVDFSKRKYAHKNYKDSETYLSRSIKKYGWNNHRMEEVFYDENVPIETANQIEIYYIRYYNSCKFNNPLGLNLNDGGMQGIQEKEQLDRMVASKFISWKNKIGKNNIPIEVYDKKGKLLISHNGAPKEIFEFLKIPDRNRLTTSFTKNLKEGKGLFNGEYIIQWEGENRYEDYRKRKEIRITELKKSPLTTKRLLALTGPRNRDHQTIPIINLQNGVFFESIKEFSIYEGVAPMSIYKRFNKGKYDGKYELLKHK